MKLLASILLLFGVSLAAAPLSAQVDNRSFSKTIKISPGEVRIDSLLKILNRQTGIQFSFNSNKISPAKKLPVPSQQLTLSQWLTTLKTKAGIDHKVIGTHIILVDKKQLATISTTNKTPASTLQKNAINKAKLSSDPPLKNQSEPAAGKIKSSEKAGAISPDPVAVFPDTFSLQFAALEEKEGSPAIGVFAANQPAVTYNKLITKPPLVDGAKPNVSKKTINDAVSGSFVRPLSKIDLGPQGVGVSFERRLGKKSIIDFSLGLGGGYAITGQQFQYKVDGLSGPEIYASINPRIYYNRQKRFLNGKSVDRNAGNYFGFRMKYVTDALAENFVVWDAVLFNFHWGMQRPVGRRWIFNGHVGPGYGFAHSFIFGNRLTGLNHYYGSVELKMSYVFSRLNQ